MKKILGFDISSTTTGWALLHWDEVTNNIKLIHVGYIKPIKKGNIIERLADTRDKIKKIIETSEPDFIGIEDIIKFMQGKSSANTIIMQATFNRMIALLSNDYLGRAPELFNILSIRHGLKDTPIFPKKEEMPDLVAKHLGITFPYETNKKGKIKVENYDKADGIAVALYYAFVLSGRIKRKGKKK